MIKLYLQGFAIYGDINPQLLIPFFGSTKSSNVSFMQSVGPDGLVSAFSPVRVGSRKIEFEGELIIGVGDFAIAALTDAFGSLIYGRTHKLAAKLSSNLPILFDLDGNVRTSFLADLALALPIGFDVRTFAKWFASTFSDLSQISPTAAAAWRDGVVIPEFVRRQQIPELADNPFFVYSSSVSCIIFVQRPFDLIANSHLKQVCRAFGISHIKMRQWDQFDESITLPLWLLIGQGGVARHVLLKEPFFGTSKFGQENNPFVCATISRVRPQLNSKRYAIGITKSDANSVDRLSEALLHYAEPSRATFVFNVRPIGFSQISERMLSPSEIGKRLGGQGGTWIVARHRLRQMPSTHNGLRASSMASRIVKLASECLISADQKENYEILDLLSEPRSVGIVSTVKLLDPRDVASNLARLFRASVSTELDIERSERFVVFWPGSTVGIRKKVRFQVLDRTFEAEILPAPSRKSTSLVGFRAQVGEASEHSFRRLCAMVMEDFNWRLRDDDGIRLLFENEGEGLFLTPVYERHQLGPALERARRDGMNELIITDFSLRNIEHDIAEGSDVMHFSEIASWMNREYGVRQYEDW